MNRPATVSLALLAACAAPVRLELGPDPGPQSVQELLSGALQATVRPWPKSKGEVDALCAQSDALVLVARHPLVRCPLADDVRQALATRVRAGTRLLLLGATARLVHDLGFEPVAPDRIGVYRWGLSDQTVLGSYVFGLRTQQVATAAFVDQLEAEEQGPAGATSPASSQNTETFWFGGGELVSVQCCQWETKDPEQGEVLGRLSRVRDGERLDLDAVVLARWHPEGGQVVALGCMPEPWREDPRIGGNARRLLANSVRALLEDCPKRRVTVLTDAAPKSAVPAGTRPRLAARELPGAPSLALWGIDVSLDATSNGRVPKSKEQVLQTLLLPAWSAGAGLMQVAPADHELGYPLPWPRDDRLARPGAYFGGEHWPQWGARGLHSLAVEAHARGLLAELRLDPSPVRNGSRAELLTAARFLARELCDARRLARGAFDGCLVRDWGADPDGVTQDLVGCLQPEVLLLDAQLRALPLCGFAQAQDAALGRPLGLEAAGISEQWRDALGPDVLAAVLDARTRCEPGHKAHGGGSYPDWLAIQAADFARARVGRGARIVWEGCDPARDPATFAAALGISLDPLKTALAGRLLASGQDGWRALQRGFAANVQSGFGAETPLPHDMPFLQNNHVRLCGSGGPLLWDPSGTARYGQRPAPREVSPGLLTTRVRGAKPSPDVVAQNAVDFLRGSPRGPGGYSDEVIVRGEERSVPAQLALDAAPRWPRKVQVAFTVPPGEWELELALRGLEGNGIVEVARDAEVTRLVAFRTGEGSVRGVYALPVARAGERTLSLEIVGGGAVAIDAFCLARRGELAAETSIEQAAGWRAGLVERTSSACLVETKHLSTIADLPGFALTIEYERVERGLMVQRCFALPAHKALRSHAPRDKPGLLREPFVLKSEDPALPDLAVVPIELPRYHSFALDADGGLALVGYPRPHERVRVGFVLLCDHEAKDVAKMPAMLAEVCEPRVLELDQNGCCDLVSDLPFRWPRVVRVHSAAPTPFLVEECGWTLWRGAQPCPDGGQQVLCYQDPGRRVRLRAGPAVTEGTRPAPGSQGLLALLANEGAGTTDGERVQVRVLQAANLAAPAGVTIGTPFDEVRLGGRLWAYGRGQTVLLPAGLGTHALETKFSGRAPHPRLAATRAPVLSATWSDTDYALEIVVAQPAETVLGDPAQPPFSWPALLSGPEPLSIDGAVRVPEDTFGYRSPSDAQKALAAGVIVRLAPGLTRVRYAPTLLSKN